MKVTELELSQLIQGCEKEELRFTSAIQDYSIFFALDHDYLIQAVSENIEQLGLSIDTIFTRNFFLLTPAYAAFEQSLESAKLYVPTQLGELSFGEHSWTLVGLAHGQGFFIELEPLQNEIEKNLASSSPKHTFKVSADNEISDFYQHLLAILRPIIDFDHIMIYRFLTEFDGEVVAELQQSQGALYLGHRFPASDIPQIARALYARTLCRIVGSVGQGTVPIRSFSHKPLDLTHCYFRSVSPVHLEYMSNMGVASSFSLPIMVNNQLWGLVACHHYTAKVLPFARRMQAIEVVQNFADAGRTAEIFAENKWHLRAEQSLCSLLLELEWKGDDLHISAKGVESISEMVDLCGFVVFDQGRFWVFGHCPRASMISDLLARFKDEPDASLVVTDRCQHKFPDLIEWPADLGGLLLLQNQFLVEKGQWRSSFLGFRKEMTQHITWAGQFEKNIAQAEDGEVRLLPRQSFKTWIEVSKGRCKAWTNLDKFKARFILNFLVEVAKE